MMSDSNLNDALTQLTLASRCLQETKSAENLEVFQRALDDVRCALDFRFVTEYDEEFMQKCKIQL